MENINNLNTDNKKKFINLTPSNIDDFILCCIVRSKFNNPGVENKRNWLREKLKDNHVYRKLNDKKTVFIEYAPLEYAWTPIDGKNYIYIYCLWVEPDCKGLGYGKELMEYCINEALKNKKSGICMLSCDKQKAWFADSEFAKKFGFKCVDKTNNGYNLLALSFDNTFPNFRDNALKEIIESENLTIYYDDQCPFTYQYIESIKKYSNDNKINIDIEKVDSLEKAKNMPCVFNNWCAFYNRKFLTVNLFDKSYLNKILK